MSAHCDTLFCCKGDARSCRKHSKNIAHSTMINRVYICTSVAYKMILRVCGVSNSVIRKIVLYAIIWGAIWNANTVVSGKWSAVSVQCEELRVELLMRNEECGMRNRVGGGQCGVLRVGS